MKKRVLCWVGNAPNHRALVNKIAASYNLVGIVIDAKKDLKKKRGPGSLWNKLFDRLRYGKIDRAWTSLQQHYGQQFPGWPDVPMLHVDSINDPSVLDFTTESAPDLVIVSGTSLVKAPLISLPLPIGIINLHTGLSPYVKGGPNCTNWCIANDQWGLIGNTIMWLSAGIDSGNIITSERTALHENDDLVTVHLKVMEHAHDLYLRAISYVTGTAAPYQSIAQSSLGKGNLYLTKMWNGKVKKNLLRNIRRTRNTKLPADIKTIGLP